MVIRLQGRRGERAVLRVGWPTSRRRFDRLRRVRWWQVAAGLLLATPIVLSFAPARTAGISLLSKTMLAVASPLAPEIEDFRQIPAPTVVVASDGRVLADVTEGDRYAFVLLAEVPLRVRRAVLAAEDRRFYEHHGVDASAVVRAALHTAKGNKQGASTITQQLAKLNYTGSERTLLRKFREVQYAVRLEKRYTKDQLLERYLNQAYFGRGVYGVAAASQVLFGVRPADLTVAQGATLAAKLRAPERLDRQDEPGALISRRDIVLRAMVRNGWLTRAELDEALDQPLTFAPPQPRAAVVAPHFVDYVLREASTLPELGTDPTVRLSRLHTGGLRVETTLDSRAYDATVAAVHQILGQPGDPNVATASVEPSTGAIRSLFGGLDYATTQYDVSSRGGRQPGSAFKPFAYLAAIQTGIDPRSMFDASAPMAVPCYGPEPVDNYVNENARGEVSLEDGLAGSINTVFAQLSCNVSSEAVLAVARSAGVPEGATKAQPAIFLGGLDNGVNALTMSAAYATFASGGAYATPHAITKITDRSGTVIYQHVADGRAVFRRDQVGVLDAGLERVVSSGTGRAAGIGRPVAGKTGTTQDNIDAWFVGFVPQLSTAVWVGYEPRQPMTNVHGAPVTGGRYPAQIFASVMRAALAGVPVAPLPLTGPDALHLQPLTTTTTTTTPPEEPIAIRTTTTTDVPAEPAVGVEP